MAFQRALVACVVMGLAGCSGGAATAPHAPLIAALPSGGAVAAADVLAVADTETLHPLDYVRVRPQSLARATASTPAMTPDGDAFRQTRALGVRRTVESSAGSNDHEDAGEISGGGGPYTAVEALHAVYLRNVDVMSPPGLSGTQTLYAPTTKSPNGGCLEAGTVYSNTAGYENPPNFYVYDFCANPTRFAYYAAIDAAWRRAYVRKSQTRLPSYDVSIGTSDAVPTAASRWTASLYNYQTKSWDLAYQSTGLTSSIEAWSIFEFYYQPGPCPPLPAFEMHDLSYYNARTAAWEDVQPTMSASTTYPVSGAPGNCFVSDTTGKRSYVFTLLEPNSDWRVHSTMY